VHIQFIDGLILLAIALAESFLTRKRADGQTRLRPDWLCGVSLALRFGYAHDPYGWRITRWHTIWPGSLAL